MEKQYIVGAIGAAVSLGLWLRLHNRVGVIKEAIALLQWCSEDISDKTAAIEIYRSEFSNQISGEARIIFYSKEMARRAVQILSSHGFFSKSPGDLDFVAFDLGQQILLDSLNVAGE